MSESESQKKRKLSSGWILKKKDSTATVVEKDPIQEFEKEEENTKDDDGFAKPMTINPPVNQKKLLPKLNNEQITELYSNCLNLSTHNVKKNKSSQFKC